MRVQLRLELDSAPDRVWDALRSPRSLAAVYAPLLELVPLEPAVFPERWPEGEARVALSTLLGIVPLGQQRIVISYAERGGTRILEDSGRPETGPLSVVTRWRHRMAVVPLPGGRSLYLDRLDVSAGLLTPVVWIGMWAMWQWRGVRMRRILSGR